MALVACASTVCAADWSSCHDDLDRLRRASSDASNAAEGVEQAAQDVESKKDDVESALRYLSRHSRRASARSRMPAPTATSSSPGTTPSTITRPSACSRPPTCITTWLSSAWPRGPSCLPRPTPRTRNASPPAGLTRRRVPWKCGSTHPRPERPRRRSYTNLVNPLSHSC